MQLGLIATGCNYLALKYHTLIGAVKLFSSSSKDYAKASLMLKQGVHPKIVSERLGHSSISITLDTYSHVMPGLQEAVALRFEESLQQTAEQSVEEMLANG